MSTLEYCYIPDKIQFFVAVQFDHNTHDDGSVITHTLDTNVESEVPFGFIDKFPISNLEEYYNPPSDLITLSDVHAPSILSALRVRFGKDLVYTAIGQILVALNPFKWIPNLYDDSKKIMYANKKLNMSDDPHVFAIADEAFTGDLTMIIYFLII